MKYNTTCADCESNTYYDDFINEDCETLCKDCYQKLCEGSYTELANKTKKEI